MAAAPALIAAGTGGGTPGTLLTMIVNCHADGNGKSATTQEKPSNSATTSSAKRCYSGVRDFARNRWPLRGSPADTRG
jgi:hypothetical protein